MRDFFDLYVICRFYCSLIIIGMYIFRDAVYILLRLHIMLLFLVNTGIRQPLF